MSAPLAATAAETVAVAGTGTPYYALIPLLPAVGFVALVLLGRRGRRSAHWVAAPLTGASLVLAVVALVQVAQGERLAVSFPWATIGGSPIDFGLLVDPLSAVMLVVVAFVALLVQVYSVGYMRDEPRYGWYYATLSLFTAAMLTLVVADGYLMMYMGWELVGLCSYLLIGFWFEEEEPRQASKKAFVVTRLGDVGFALGVIAIFGLAGTFSFDSVFASAEGWAGPAATIVALLLFAGAVGKSAQFPLHVWLPDAMAGPTPVSALIHAATMVAAGVYLVARSLPLFEASALAPDVVLLIGTITALGAATVAVVMNDIKKVLAYSTISQLGYMMMALGAGSLVAGMFHLMTHAFFKALLFLGAGSVIHATHTQDIREMGGLAREMPATTATFAIGALALSGIFPLAGFFSKDEILAAIGRAHTPALVGPVAVHHLVLVVGIAGAGLTAFYMARLFFKVFLGRRAGAQAHVHESPASMTVPLVMLAALALSAGLIAGPLAAFLAPHEAREPIDLVVAGISSAVALGGIALGWWIYVTGGLSTEVLRLRFGRAYRLLQSKYYIDDAYACGIVSPVLALAGSLARFDLGVIDWIVDSAARVTVWAAEVHRRFDERVIDGLVSLVAGIAPALGRSLRRIQTGSLTTYMRLTVGGVVGLMLLFALRG